MQLAWGTKVSEAFREGVMRARYILEIEDPNWLMAIMDFESGGTFSPSIRNAAGSGAVGLIQFMPQTAMLLGTTTEALAAMTPEDQLDYVVQYFFPHRGGMHSLADMYMVVLWPAAVGKPDDYVLFDREDLTHPARYFQNRGLDLNKDGKITKAEAAAGPLARLQQGLLAGNVFEMPDLDAATDPGWDSGSKPGS